MATDVYAQITEQANKYVDQDMQNMIEHMWIRFVYIRATYICVDQKRRPNIYESTWITTEE